MKMMPHPPPRRRGWIGFRQILTTDNNNNNSCNDDDYDHVDANKQQCPVWVNGDLASLLTTPPTSSSMVEEEDAAAACSSLEPSLRTTRQRYRDKVRVLSFDDNDNEKHWRVDSDEDSAASLRQFMEQFRRQVLMGQGPEKENECNGEEEDSDSHSDYEPSLEEQWLARIHQRFLTIVKGLLFQQKNDGLYASVLLSSQNDSDDDYQLQTYGGPPSIRDAALQYAPYLHNDAWFKDDDDEDDTPIALINVWMVLNETPPRNTLVFWETDVAHTHASHMLHATTQNPNHNTEANHTTDSNDDHPRRITVHHDADMCWGKFYVFVAGQRNDQPRVLLHGAVQLDDDNQDDDKKNGDKNSHGDTNEPRKSLEMRYKVMRRRQRET